MPSNSLRAAISQNMADQAEIKPVESVSPKKAASPAKATKIASRANTVLIGGHFPPEVKQQLRLIAAEEGKTSQSLIAEALDLLFTKKGKGKIKDL